MATRRPVRGKPWNVSLFARHLYANGAGVDIGVSVQAQRNAGRKLGHEPLVWGDLIFFSDDDHVGIYVGDGMFMQAPESGDVVKISPLAGRRDFVQARRIVE